MNETSDLDRIVADWLRAEAPTRAPGRVLTAALEQAAAVGQKRPFGGRPFDAWIGRSPRLHWAIVGAILALLLLGAVAGAGALLAGRSGLLERRRQQTLWRTRRSVGPQPFGDQTVNGGLVVHAMTSPRSATRASASRAARSANIA